MLGRRNRSLVEPLAGAHGRQPARLLVFRVFVLTLLVEGEEAVELHHGAGGAQFEDPAAHLGGNIGRGAFEFRRFHLARDGAEPDQFVEPGLVGIEVPFRIAWLAGEVGRPDGFRASCAFFALVS